MFAVRKGLAMPSNTQIFKSVAFEDGIYSVLKTDPANPRFMEVVATFYDAARAQDYANIANGETTQPVAEVPVSASKSISKHENAEPMTATPELSARQAAVLHALRAIMDDSRLVEVKAANLAEEAQIPLGSLHSVLGSLEKKQLILTTRPGSPRAPAVYQVL
jgi:hypothetical protein